MLLLLPVSLGLTGFALKVFFERSHMALQPAPRFLSPSCQKAYLDLFKNSEADIRVVFGYKDARPARFVADRYEKMIFVQRAIQDCQKGEQLCEFVRDPFDMNLFSKKITGPDGHPKRVRLHIVDSSAGPDDEENRRNPFQKWKSAVARTSFLEGLTQAQIVLYNGHSRAGGGPDFSPAVLRRDQHVAYAQYKQNPTGLKEMMKALDPTSPLVLLGIFSCASDKLFSDQIKNKKEKLGLITSEKLLYFSDALESLGNSLAAILEMKCQPELKSAIESNSSQAGTRFISFF